MMTGKFDSLCAFLKQNSANQGITERAIELLQKFEFTDGKRWSTLAPLDPRLDTEVALALHAAVDSQVERIIFVSLNSGPQTLDDWIPAEVTDDSGFADNIDVLNHMTEFSQGPVLVESGKDTSFCGNDYPGCECCPMISEDIDDDVFEGLHRLVMQNLNHEDGPADPTIGYLETYLTFVLFGCQAITNSMNPLIKVLPRAVPFGVKDDEPGAWLVLCG